MSAKREFIVVKCATHGYAVAVTSEEEGVAFELVQWGVPKGQALAQANDFNERPPLILKHD